MTDHKKIREISNVIFAIKLLRVVKIWLFFFFFYGKNSKYNAGHEKWKKTPEFNGSFPESPILCIYIWTK